MPVPGVSVIVAGEPDTSPQLMVAVCVSCLPTSVKDAPMLMVPPTGISPADAVTAPKTGLTLLNVTVLCDTTGVLVPSDTDSAAFKTASSSQETDGFRVVVSAELQVVPGSWSVGEKTHVVVNGSFSGSDALPERLAVDPSLALYGPPADAVGGPFAVTT